MSVNQDNDGDGESRQNALPFVKVTSVFTEMQDNLPGFNNTINELWNLVQNDIPEVKVRGVTGDHTDTFYNLYNSDRLDDWKRGLVLACLQFRFWDFLDGQEYGFSHVTTYHTAAAQIWVHRFHYKIDHKNRNPSAALLTEH